MRAKTTVVSLAPPRLIVAVRLPVASLALGRVMAPAFEMTAVLSEAQLTVVPAVGLDTRVRSLVTLEALSPLA